MLDMLPLPAAYAPADGALELNQLWRELTPAAPAPADLAAACAALLRWSDAEAAAAQRWIAALTPADPPLSLAGQLRRDPARHIQLIVRRSAQATSAQAVEISALHAARLAAERQLAIMLDAIDSIDEGFALYDADDRLVFCNARYREIYAESADLMVPGRTFAEILRGGAERGQYPAAIGRVEEWVAERIARHQALEQVEQPISGGRWLRIVERRTADGGIAGIRADITDLKAAEELRRQVAVSEQLIAAQSALLAELSTPLLDVGRAVLLAPLVGSFDTARASRLIETLLTAVNHRQARVVVLDITGVPVIDTQVAHVLLQCARSVQLIGARVILTGIRPDVAQTIVSLGVDLSEIATRGDLREGVRYALASENKRV